MATIYVDNLINPSLINVPDTVTYKKPERIKEYSFSDLHLDFQINSTLEDGSYGVTTNDIVADYDNDAIKNSIKNIFNTRKGMRYLNPEFGSSFDQFLFESVSPINARILAQKINDHIIKYENRITLLRVFVQSYYFVCNLLGTSESKFGPYFTHITKTAILYTTLGRCD